MTIKPGDKFKTRDGHEVEIDRIYTNGITHPVFGRVKVWENHNWTVDGKWLGERPDHRLDLITPSERKSVWVNWYGCKWHYDTRETADMYTLSKDPNIRTHVLEIIMENGEPVDVKIHRVEEWR